MIVVSFDVDKDYKLDEKEIKELITYGGLHNHPLFFGTDIVWYL